MLWGGKATTWVFLIAAVYRALRMYEAPCFTQMISSDPHNNLVNLGSLLILFYFYFLALGSLIKIWGQNFFQQMHCYAPTGLFYGQHLL